MHTSSIRSALASAFLIPLRHAVRSPLNTTSPSIRSSKPNNTLQAITTRSQFSTSSTRTAKKAVQVTDRRVTLIRYFLHHPTTLMPRPLRFSRTRALRHWTIHRAWQLFQAKKKASRTLELQRQYMAMAAANEDLRVGAGEGGKLFRKASMKTGTWSIPQRGGGVPIEYAKGLVDWVGTVDGMGKGESGQKGKAKIWDESWKRL